VVKSFPLEEEGSRLRGPTVFPGFAESAKIFQDPKMGSKSSPGKYQSVGVIKGLGTIHALI